MIKATSYNDISGLGFGALEAEAIKQFGNPVIRRRNREMEVELHYRAFILRFTASSGQLRECTLLPQCEALINEVPITWDEKFLDWLASEDNSLKEVLGFILSIKLGIAVSGFHDGDEPQKAIHIFSRGNWDRFSSRMHPFPRAI